MKKKHKFTKPCRWCGGSGQEIDDRALGADMRKLRQSKGFTGRQMAKLLRKSAVYLSDLELGRRRWTPEITAEFTFHCHKTNPAGAA